MIKPFTTQNATTTMNHSTPSDSFEPSLSPSDEPNPIEPGDDIAFPSSAPHLFEPPRGPKGNAIASKNDVVDDEDALYADDDLSILDELAFDKDDGFADDELFPHSSTYFE
jgi:hypothetical protein